MNRRKSKRVKYHAELLQILWLKSLLNEEEASRVNMGNYKDMLPEQTHIWASGTLYNSFYTAKWLSIKIKQLIKIFPTKQIEDITPQDIQWKMEQR
jgi:hypothetical protein|tara:strand:+ start:502 stop:789 length:288 start_codon:yes stop_codon:yes gene_type:complete